MRPIKLLMHNATGDLISLWLASLTAKFGGWSADDDDDGGVAFVGLWLRYGHSCVLRCFQMCYYP